MTYETYENLKRVNARRKRTATYYGNWKEVARCSEEDQRLDAEYQIGREISPEPAGHPDNPVFMNNQAKTPTPTEQKYYDIKAELALSTLDDDEEPIETIIRIIMDKDRLTTQLEIEKELCKAAIKRSVIRQYKLEQVEKERDEALAAWKEAMADLDEVLAEWKEAGIDLSAITMRFCKQIKCTEE
jgi:hypothetical protein